MMIKALCPVVTFCVSLLITAWTWWRLLHLSSIARAAKQSMEQANDAVLLMRSGSGACASAVNRLFEAQAAFEQADQPTEDLVIPVMLMVLVTTIVGTFMAETRGWLEHLKPRRAHGV